MKSTPWVQLLAAAALVSCSGCLITHHSTNVIRRHEARQPVHFESDLARQAFNARLEAQKEREQNKRATVLAIPFLLWYSRVDAKSENALFNDEAAVCDADADGRISYAEALAYNPTFEPDPGGIAHDAAPEPWGPNPIRPAAAQAPPGDAEPVNVLR